MGFLLVVALMDEARDKNTRHKDTSQFGSISFSQNEERNIGLCLAKKLGKDTTTQRPGAGNCMFFFIL